MNKLTITLLIILSLTLPQNLSADNHTGDQHSQNLEIVLNEIITSQQVNSTNQIDCDQLSEHQLEELGEAVMSEMHPDPVVHKQMDKMMGGEGSENLKQAHINMATNYLNCTGTRYNNTGMMGQNNQLNSRGGDYNMPTLNNVERIGYDGFGQMMRGIGTSGFGLFWLINSILFTALLVTLIRYFWNKGGKP